MDRGMDMSVVKPVIKAETIILGECLGLALILSNPAFGEIRSGVITGAVTDPAGAVIPVVMRIRF